MATTKKKAIASKRKALVKKIEKKKEEVAAETAAKKKPAARKKKPAVVATTNSILTSAMWVRLTIQKGKGVPDECLGMEAVILEAPTVKNPGSEKGLSPRPFETQPDDTMFSVRVRENGTLLMVKREAFDRVSPDRGGLARV